MRARMATIDHKVLEISFSYIQWLSNKESPKV